MMMPFDTNILSRNAGFTPLACTEAERHAWRLLKERRRRRLAGLWVITARVADALRMSGRLRRNLSQG